MKILKLYNPKTRETKNRTIYVRFDGNLVEGIKRASKMFKAKYTNIYYEFEGEWSKHDISSQIKRFQELLRASKNRPNNLNQLEFNFDSEDIGGNIDADGWITIE